MSIEQILEFLMDKHTMPRSDAIKVIAQTLNRSESLVQGWLSGRAVPEHSLELLNLVFK